ncbi:MAG: DNA-binding protein WhiA [Halanaerobiaceae bacterium]
MSFTADVKHEIAQISGEELPELAALVRMDGSIHIINKDLALKLRIYLGDLARKIYKIIKKQFNLKMEIMVRKDRHFDIKHNIYELSLAPQAGLNEFLFKLGVIDKDKNLLFRINEEFINNRKSQRAYLRGAFLGGGSVNKPGSEYHLEFRCEHLAFAKDLIQLLEKFDLKGHLTEHNNKFIVYFKSFEEIITILNIIGAHQALLKMEDKYVLKDIKNNINRKVNFETANLDKTINAAMRQIEDIELIEASESLDSLSKSLQEIARLRKENPYASLKELGEILNISKSAANHRMRRIKKIASEIREK